MIQLDDTEAEIAQARKRTEGFYHNISGVFRGFTSGDTQMFVSTTCSLTTANDESMGIQQIPVINKIQLWLSLFGLFGLFDLFDFSVTQTS